MRYKISVKTLQGTILTFSVNEFVNDNNMISFTDEKNKKFKMFSSTRCEIEVLSND